MYIIYVKEIEGIKISDAILQNRVCVRKSLFPIPTMKLGKITYSSRRIIKNEKRYYRKSKHITPKFFESEL